MSAADPWSNLQSECLISGCCAQWRSRPQGSSGWDLSWPCESLGVPGSQQRLNGEDSGDGSEIDQGSSWGSEIEWTDQRSSRGIGGWVEGLWIDQTDWRMPGQPSENSCMLGSTVVTLSNIIDMGPVPWLCRAVNWFYLQTGAEATVFLFIPSPFTNKWPLICYPPAHSHCFFNVILYSII